MRSKLPYLEYTVNELNFPYIRISYSDRISTLVLGIPATVICVSSTTILRALYAHWALPALPEIHTLGST
jgi:hypothetical protein